MGVNSKPMVHSGGIEQPDPRSSTVHWRLGAWGMTSSAGSPAVSPATAVPERSEATLAAGDEGSECSIQSGPNTSIGCWVRSVPFPQRMSSAAQYRSHPQHIRSGCAGRRGILRLIQPLAPASGQEQILLESPANSTSQARRQRAHAAVDEHISLLHMPFDRTSEGIRLAIAAQPICVADKPAEWTRVCCGDRC